MIKTYQSFFFDRYYADSNYIVSIDNTEGARQAVKYLIENGHQNIAMITGPLSYRSARTRIDGYKEALVEAGLQVNEDYIVVGDYTFDGGQRAAKIIGEFDEVTAVFASNDLMAYGAMKEFSDSGKNVPNDISIVGFDDLNFSQMLRTPLTSVKQNLKELAENVFGLTMRAINGYVAPTHKVVATNLIERDSVVNRESVHNISAVK
ncbi:MAG: substrate-binding domain-containing protein [Clostridia bacterium]|nr:substrate-binding domain-containing protein [Clostridia bacterium]